MGKNVIKLHSKENYTVVPVSHKNSFIAKVTLNSKIISPLRSKFVFIWNKSINEIPEGFLLILIPFHEANNLPIVLKNKTNTVFISQDLNYLSEDDVIKFYPENI